MTRQLAIFVDCPYGGCEDGYCACLDVDPDVDEDQGDAPERGSARPVGTVPISIDDYEPPQGIPCLRSA
ncbi:hypothetical protein STRCI_001324 [Streptomyces cinnabarinus]|uniref:Ferredoxin n=1 Tax=Streptomyces cinnabarinus TaxID=67287 RepID=A0ABY7K9J9_9ACTN|nr:hypothetical protein [Streptomyces cinnabarinus]WAZ20223.1 hypothetical protein STRCI_001324 [Streptomyces cinnabarinus]